MYSKARYLVGAAAGLLILAGTAIPTFAADPTPTTTPCGVALQRGGGRGAGPWGGVGQSDSVTKLLGLDSAQIAEQRQDGKSLAAIAKTKSVDEAKLVETIITDRKAQLDARVKAGTLTQSQEDLMLERMQAQVKTAVERTTVGPMGPQAGAGLGIGTSGQGPRFQDQSGQSTPSQGLGRRRGAGSRTGANR